jgi:DNA-binding beta-propeller fold protein YncE
LLGVAFVVAVALLPLGRREAAADVVPPGTLLSVAGVGELGFRGDGGPAVEAHLYVPLGIAADGEGNLYFADEYNHRIRRIDAQTGIISTFAGTGATGNYNGGYLGDGVPARRALLNHPKDVALDSGGFLFIADGWNSCIRVVNPDGVISKIAGNLDYGFYDDGDVADETPLSTPYGIAVSENGDLYVADGENHRVRKIDAATRRMITVAGGGPAGDPNAGSYSGDGGPATAARLSNPRDVALDGRGHLYIVDFGNHLVRRLDLATGILTRFAGTTVPGYDGDGVPALRAKLNGPQGIAVDSAGNVFIADTGNDRIRKVDAQTGIISTVAGGGRLTGLDGDRKPATAARLVVPVGLAIDRNGDLFFTQNNHRIWKVTGIAAPGLMAGRPFPPPTTVPGDVDGDGRVTILDVQAALQAAIGVRILSPAQTLALDLTGDGAVDLQDVTRLLRVAIGR